MLDALRAAMPTPVGGIFPPLHKALARSTSKQVAVLGMASLVNSETKKAFVRKHAGPDLEVTLVNASTLVDLVERSTFLSDPAATGHVVRQLIGYLRRCALSLDVMTLSTTRLPWLRPFFEGSVAFALVSRAK